MRHWKQSMVLAAAACAGLCAAGRALAEPATDPVAAAWAEDFRAQPLSRRPKIEARYVDAGRSALEVVTQDYRLALDFKGARGSRIRSLSAPGVGDMLTGDGAYLSLTIADGTACTSLNARQPSRVNIYRRGPYTIETHWLDVPLADAGGKALPIKGEVVFTSYPEKVHISVILHVTGDVEVRDAALVFNLAHGAALQRFGPAGAPGPESAVVIGDAPNRTLGALFFPAPGSAASVEGGAGNRVAVHMALGASGSWAKGSQHTLHCAFIPVQGPSAARRLQAELRPLPASALKASSGRALGYDPVRGCYTVRTSTPGGFNHHFANPNDYEVATFSITNDGLPRKVYVMHDTDVSPGAVECGILLDQRGDPLPITMQISKNFAGEIEEPFYNPTDIPFSETFFPIHLKPRETRRMTSLHLYQNWGSKPLKQFSSLGAWMDYYHMSTGVTETTCYVPFNFAGLPGVSIADFRGMSQPYWSSQPQHDNVAGHSFLRYRDAAGKWHYAEYTGTTFRSTGPNWADMSMHYLMDDGSARVTADVFELPASDELRNFIRLRVDFLKDVGVYEDDPARNVLLLNAASWVQGMRYDKAAVGGPTGEPRVFDIRMDGTPTTAAEPIPSPNGYMVVYPHRQGANAFVVRNFSGKLSGKPVRPGMTVVGYGARGPMRKPGDTVLSLAPATEAKRIRAGDWIEADLFLMPYGGPAPQDPLPARKATFDFGANAPRLTSVVRGKKVADFPTRVRLDASGKAQFTVTGGFDRIPIIVEGARSYSGLRLYCIDSGKQLVPHSQPGQTDGYQTTVLPDGTFGSVFLYQTDGKPHRFLVE